MVLVALEIKGGATPSESGCVTWAVMAVALPNVPVLSQERLIQTTLHCTSFWSLSHIPSMTHFPAIYSLCVIWVEKLIIGLLNHDALDMMRK